ncbi:MAG: hypothetical protein GY760_13710, partial [Deltaproteobacteria bacterium]|nr:hypothetical protein [Deltaproteobacteria bacterium]
VGLLTINNGDSDNDQMKDSWEIANFGNLDQTGTIDSDNDGLTDLQEYQNDTNPNSKDTDSDGMDDGWEVANGLNPKSDDTLLDSDGDGFSNIAEYLAGTDPKSGTDIPVKLAITETFESGDLKTLNWKNSSIPWLVTGAGPKNGFNSVESPAIEDKTNGNLELSMYCQQGDISFWYRVSSEKDYDYLKFYIDDVFQGGWSGEVAYTQASYAVAKGMHTFKWVYSKDGSGSSGEDLAMLDDIIFPGSLDSDSDGMPNSWEVENNLNPAVNDALEDFDSDGFSNFAEFVAGSDPSDINSKPVFTDKTEDFESGILSNPFVLSGDGEWSIVDSEGFSSTKGFKSPALSDKKSASFENTMYCESGDVSFRVSVSSEEFDYLYFYIDGELKGNWSGDVPYTQVSFPVTAGMHTFKWKYSKDGAASGGTDNALIDDITFPGSLDSDSDGMPDGWEIINKLNPMFNDANIDSDNDGFINLHEYYANTDPNVHDDTISYPVPVANAGSDQTVTEGVEVTLDGSLSTGVGTVSYKWRQVSGTVVTLSDDTLAKPTFTAPTETLVFELIVEDVGGLTNSSTVNIIINK